MKRAVLIIALMLAPLAAEAQSACASLQLGWHFYCDPTPPKSEPVVPPQTIPPSEPDPVAEIAAIRKELQTRRARAILDPTPENIAAYLVYQGEQLDRARIFSDAWQRLLWQTPELDYQQEKPQGTLAKRVWTSARKQEASQILAELGGALWGVFLLSLALARIAEPSLPCSIVGRTDTAYPCWRFRLMEAHCPNGQTLSATVAKPKASGSLASPCLRSCFLTPRRKPYCPSGLAC